MAKVDSTIPVQAVVLYDKWPGSSSGVTSTIIDGPLGTYSNNVSALPQGLKLGTKIRGHNDGSVTGSTLGDYTLIYLQAGTHLSGQVVAAGTIMVPVPAVAGVFDYVVSNNAAASGAVLTTGSVVALGAWTDAYCAWAWCGGVCPDFLVTLLGGASAVLYTDGTIGTVAVGQGLMAGVAVGTVLTANAAVLYTLVSTGLGCGIALAADTV